MCVHWLFLLLVVRPVSTSGMFSKPSIGISYQRDHNQHESGVLINYTLIEAMSSDLIIEFTKLNIHNYFFVAYFSIDWTVC